jgi:hypothetical protein
LSQTQVLVEFYNEMEQKLLYIIENEQYVKIKNIFEIFFRKVKRVASSDFLDGPQINQFLEEFKNNYIELFTKKFTSKASLTKWFEILEKRNRTLEILDFKRLKYYKNRFLESWEQFIHIKKQDSDERRDEVKIEALHVPKTSAVSRTQVEIAKPSSNDKIREIKEEQEISTQDSVKNFDKINIFMSYSTKDSDYFQISKIVRRLELYPEINKVLFWEVDSRQNIVEFMEETLRKTNVFILFCSQNSINSMAVKDEWQSAFQLRKKGLMKIVPVYETDEHIPYLLMPMLNVIYNAEDFSGFIQKLHEEIVR